MIQIEDFLTKIEILCQKRQIRLTPQRKTVITLMAKAQGAISAYELLDQLKLIEAKAKPPTVYRALDFFIEQGFIHKIESTNHYILCHHVDAPSHTSILLICKKCHRVQEQQATDIEAQLQNLANGQQFTLQHSIVEVHGICRDCANESIRT